MSLVSRSCRYIGEVKYLWLEYHEFFIILIQNTGHANLKSFTFPCIISLLCAAAQPFYRWRDGAPCRLCLLTCHGRGVVSRRSDANSVQTRLARDRLDGRIRPPPPVFVNNVRGVTGIDAKLGTPLRTSI